MISPISQDLTGAKGISEEQITRRENLATQTLVGLDKTQGTSRNQHPAPVTTTPETSSSRTNLLDRLSQLYWRVSCEVDPLFRCLFAPFTAEIRRCSLLSARDKAELEALMKKQ